MDAAAAVDAAALDECMERGRAVGGQPEPSHSCHSQVGGTEPAAGGAVGIQLVRHMLVEAQACHSHHAATAAAAAAAVAAAGGGGGGHTSCAIAAAALMVAQLQHAAFAAAAVGVGNSAAAPLRCCHCPC
jgi:hypothetical protein